MKDLQATVEEAAAYLRSGRYDRAVVRYRDALRLDARQPELHLDLGTPC